MTNVIGQKLGNYRLIRLLGRGGFAAVYLGEHDYLNTQAAIKVLHTHLTEADSEHFQREAQTIASLIHPHIVRVLDFDVEAGVPFLVMDYAPNGTLRQRHPTGVQLPLDTVLTYVKPIAAGLQYAHEHKLVHRDVKPENMLLGSNYDVLLTDFGIAISAWSSHLQSMQQIAGTARYMAPEQFHGKPRFASDQYALAVVVYEWLSGGPPFRGTFSELHTQHLFDSPPSLCEKVPALAPEVEQVILRALAKDPKERFDTVQAFAVALEQASRVDQPHSSFLSPPLTVPSKPLTLTSSAMPLRQDISRRAIILGLVVAGLVVAGGSLTWLVASQEEHPSVVSGQTPASTSQPTLIPLGTTLLTYKGHSAAVIAVAWSPDGKRIASGSADNTVQVWDATYGGNVYIYRGHSVVLDCVAWSPDSKRIASGGDYTVQVWDAANGDNISTYVSNSGAVTAVAWSPNGKYIASGSHSPLGNTVQIWNPMAGNTVLSYTGNDGPIYGVAWSPDSKYIASTGNSKLHVCDAMTGSNLSTYPDYPEWAVVAVDWSPDGHRIAFASSSEVQVWNINTGKKEFTYLQSDPGHADSVRTVKWSPDGKYIASGSTGGTVKVWSSDTGNNILTYKGHTSWVYCLAWSPDGKRIASGSADNTVQVWQAP